MLVWKESKRRAMSILEEINFQVRRLPPSLQAEVLDFVDFLVSESTESSHSNQSNLPCLHNKRGSGKNVINYVSDDFDAPLDDLKDYS